MKKKRRNKSAQAAWERKGGYHSGKRRPLPPPGLLNDHVDELEECMGEDSKFWLVAHVESESADHYMLVWDWYSELEPSDEQWSELLQEELGDEAEYSYVVDHVILARDR